MKSRNISYYLFLGMLLISISLNAQSPPDPNKPPPPHPELPIDGGLTYLLVAGIAFGVYTLKKKKIFF